jgi:hypothetical protein
MDSASKVRFAAAWLRAKRSLEDINEALTNMGTGELTPEQFALADDRAFRNACTDS